MSLLINKNLNLVKSDQKRIWLENGNLAEYVKPGQGMAIRDVKDAIVVKFVPKERADRVVSKRKVRGNVRPLIEISDTNSDLLKEWDVTESLRIVVTTKGIKISINKNTIEAKVHSRERRFRHACATGELKVGSVFAGIGGLDFAAHDGFAKAGIETKLKFAIDNHEASLMNIKKNMSEILAPDSLLIYSDIAELNVGSNALPEVDLFYCTPSCTDASQAGRAKKKNTFETAKTCTLVYYFTQLLERCAPGVFVLENVVGYRDTLSFQFLMSLLAAWKYKVQIRVIDSNNEGFSFEARKRMYVVATSENLVDSFCLDDVVNIGDTPPAKLGDIIIPIEDDHKAWKQKTHLFEKEKRDAEKGSSFAMQIFDEESTHIGVLRAGIQKSGSSDPLIKNLVSNMYRIPFALEHCLAKGYPAKIIAGRTEGAAHFGLGNSVIYNVIKSITYFLGKSIAAEQNSRDHVLVVA